jgi:NAD-dependent DNA ligase
MKKNNLPKETIERIRKLKKLISYHGNLYHTLDKPEVSDEVYDSFVRELEKIEEDYLVYGINYHDMKSTSLTFLFSQSFPWVNYFFS